MEQIAAVVTVFAESIILGLKQGKNPCQPGLRPDASAAHPGRYILKIFFCNSGSIAFFVLIAI